MKKKLLVVFMACTLLITLALPVSALAAPLPVRGGYCGGLMWDDDGNFLDRDAFEERLDKAIEDGFIPSGDRDYCLEMYDYCIGGGMYGGGAYGGRGCCGGRGRRY